MTEDGNLCITSAMDRNITLDVKGRGRVLINNHDILQLLLQNSTFSGGGGLAPGFIPNRIATRVNILYNDVRGPRRGILRRLARLENG